MTPPVKAGLAVLSLALAGLAARSLRPPAILVEEQRPAATEPAAPIPPDTRSTGARAFEAREALARVFGGAVAWAPADPRFVTADLNGDGAQDLVVIVSPSPGRLADVNNRLANWTVQDVHVPLAKESTRAASPGRVQEGDTLVAVVHGHQAAGWRSPEARQAYLLRSAEGIGMKAVHPSEVVAGGGPVPRLRGDVLTLSGTGGAGFVYWTGARYALWRLPTPTVRRSTAP